MTEPTSIWKKEISFRRKRDDAAPEASAAPPPVAPPARDESPSIWKREIRLGRRRSLSYPVLPSAPASDPPPPEELVAAPEISVRPEVGAQPVEPPRPLLFDPPPEWDAEPPAFPQLGSLQAPLAHAPDPEPAMPETAPEPHQLAEPELYGWSEPEPGPVGADQPQPGWWEPAAEAPLAAEPEPAPADGPYGWWQSSPENDAVHDEVLEPRPADPLPEPEAAENTEPWPSTPATEPDLQPELGLDRAAREWWQSAAEPEPTEEAVPLSPVSSWEPVVEPEPERAGAGFAWSAPASEPEPEPEPDASPEHSPSWSFSEPERVFGQEVDSAPEAPAWSEAGAAAEAELPVFEEPAHADEPAWADPGPELEPAVAGEIPLAVVPEPEAAPVAWSEPDPVVAPEDTAVPEPQAVQVVAQAGTAEVEDAVEAEVADPAPAGPKPSLLKRELHLPRPRRRTSTARSSADAKSGSNAKNVVGLRIGSSQLAAAHVHNNGAAELLQIARSPIERGIVANGEVRDPEALSSALKAFFAEHKLPRRGVRLGIASNRIGVRVLEVPALDDPKLFDNSIRFHAQEALPIAITDAILDHVVLGEAGVAGQDRMVHVLLVFAHRELVERHVEACKRAGVKLEGVDFEAFALLRALAERRPEDVAPQQAIVAVAVGQERTIFAVSDGRICDFTRVLEWGGGTLDVVLARALDLTPSQAEPLKLALSLDGEVAPSQLSPVQVEAARAAMKTELQVLAREIVSSLQFYQARPGSLDIGEILLAGGGAQLPGFAPELERLVGVPVRLGDPFAQVQLGKKVSRPIEAGSLAVAIGLGIEHR